MRLTQGKPALKSKDSNVNHSCTFVVMITLMCSQTIGNHSPAKLTCETSQDIHQKIEKRAKVSVRNLPGQELLLSLNMYSWALSLISFLFFFPKDCLFYFIIHYSYMCAYLLTSLILFPLQVITNRFNISILGVVFFCFFRTLYLRTVVFESLTAHKLAS